MIHYGQKNANKNMKILVVDDDRCVVETLSMTLQMFLGQEIVQANGGLEAVKIFEKDPSFDLVITDREMPDLDGIGLIKAIKVIAPRTRFIMMSGNFDKESRRAAQLAGAEVLLDKPLDPCVLEAAIKNT